VISDKDVASGYGDATTELTTWVRKNATLVGSYNTFTYDGLQLWRSPVDPYAPLADTEPMPGGSFIITDANRCGGFPVVDGPTGGFDSGVAALGGKQVVGAPVSGSWTTTPGVRLQVFTGAVLTAAAGRTATALPVVPQLARVADAAYRAAGLPPVTADPGAGQSGDLLTDKAIADAYLRGGDRAQAGVRLGDPIGPPTTMPDGYVRQAFAGGVLEHPTGSDAVRLAAIAPLVLKAGLVTPDTAAASPLAAPPLPADVEPGQPTTVRPFVAALLAGLALYVALPVLATEFARLLRRPRPRSGPAQPSPTGAP
jgi:hypothetical protein